MSSITLAAHGCVGFSATWERMDNSDWCVFVINTSDEFSDQSLRINGFFRDDARHLAKEYAEAIEAVNARHRDRLRSEEAEAA